MKTKGDAFEVGETESEEFYCGTSYTEMKLLHQNEVEDDAIARSGAVASRCCGCFVATEIDQSLNATSRVEMKRWKWVVQ